MKLSQAQIDGILRRHKPRGWKVAVVAPNGRHWAFADRTNKLIGLTFHPKDAWGIQIFLHEVGHVKFKHADEAPQHVEEYEAELYALVAMKNEGIPVPRIGMRRAKSAVYGKIVDDEARDIEIVPQIRKWCTQ